MKDIPIPVSIVGPGSQPTDPDNAVNDFVNLPDEMMTYQAPVLPEQEEAKGLDVALTLAEELLQALRGYQVGDPVRIIELNDLDDCNRQFFDQLLGEGEVSIQCSGSIRALIQESVLAGVWRVQYMNQHKGVQRDTIEVAEIPALVRAETFNGAQDDLQLQRQLSGLTIPDSVYNAAPLLTEIRDKLQERRSASEPHVINLSLLPHTESDLSFLSDVLGIGSIIILSRGYGNCRISSTNTRNVWWVQYFNSQEALILNTLEISQVPEVACAASEDLQESAERLGEILTVYR